MKAIVIILLILLKCDSLNDLQGTVEILVNIKPPCGIVQANNNGNNNPCGMSDEALNEIYNQYEIEILDKNKKVVKDPKKVKKGENIIENLLYGDYSINVNLKADNKKTIVAERQFTINAYQKKIITIDVDSRMQ